MYHKRLALGVAAALAGVATADSSNVTQLTGKSFKEFFANSEFKIVLAEFYAPWCGHCKALAPEYENAANELLQKDKKDIKLVKIDCTEEADLCQEHGVEGYPTLKVFHGLDEARPYNGQRNAKSIVSYMVKQSLPPVSSLTKETLGDFKTADKVVLVGYVATDDKESNDVFTSVAKMLRDEYMFGTINDAAVSEAEGVKFPSIVLYKTFDEGKNTFEKKFEEPAIVEFAKIAAIPLVGEVGPETYSNYMESGIPLAYIFAETPEERESLRKELKPVSEEHRGKVNFATIDAKKFGTHAGNLNLKTDKFPSFAIQDIANNKKYPFDQEKEVTYKNIAKFVTDYVNGQVEPSVKSEPIPEKQKGPVTVVVAHNYEKVVLDDKKDVLIEFYAPWCGHCKALAPKYEELAAKYSSSDFKDKVVIAKVDATANDVPDDIVGFPTIKIYPAGDKNAVTYSGSRTIEDLVEFIKENGKYKAGISFKEATEEAAATATKKANNEEKKAKDDDKANEDKKTEAKGEEHDEL